LNSRTRYIYKLKFIIQHTKCVVCPVEFKLRLVYVRVFFVAKKLKGVDEVMIVTVDRWIVKIFYQVVQYLYYK
jgi:hypothetical protein